MAELPDRLDGAECAGRFSASSPSIVSPTASSLTMATVRLKPPVLFSTGVALKVPVLPDMQEPPKPENAEAKIPPKQSWGESPGHPVGYKPASYN